MKSFLSNQYDFLKVHLETVRKIYLNLVPQLGYT